MTKIEALELELAARKMVEGTWLEWWHVIKYHAEDRSTTIEEHALCMNRNRYELALGILEGKPVWEGDKIYTEEGTKKIAVKYMQFPGHWSWSPPKPKTVMVELLVEDAKAYAGVHNDSGAYLRVAEACRKALGG